MGFTVSLIADDYALTAGVSRGILRLIAAGRLTGTGAMVTFPAWKGWSHALRGLTGVAEVGLHLNLTAGAPVVESSRLAPAGRLPALGALVGMSLARRIDRKALSVEIAAQLDRFEQAVGRRPDFVDGHQHAHALPVVRTVLLEILVERYRAGGRPWLRDPYDAPAAILARGRQVPKALAVAILASGFRRAAHRAGFRTNEGFSGFSAFADDGDFASEFAAALRRPGRDHVLMVHPGEADDGEIAGLDPAVGSRPRELAYLLGPALEAALTQAGVMLRRPGACSRPPGGL